jgi:uncharacterized protein
MLLKIGKKAIDFLFSSPHQSLSLTFFGGEPLLEYDLVKKLVEYAYHKAKKSDKKIQFGIVSNGSLITNEILNFCKKYKIIFALSCDGMKSSQDAYRILKNGKGTFNLIKANIPKIATLDTAIVRLTITPETTPFLYENIKFFYNSGFRKILAFPIDQANWKDNELNILKKQIIKTTKYYLEILKHNRNFILLPHVYYLFDNFLQNDYFRMHGHSCWAGNEGLCISTDGTIYPCHRFTAMEKFAIGNLDTNQKLNLNSVILNKFYKLKTKRDKIGCLAINYQYSGFLEKMPQSSEKLKLVLKAAFKRIREKS